MNRHFELSSGQNHSSSLTFPENSDGMPESDRDLSVSDDFRTAQESVQEELQSDGEDGDELPQPEDCDWGANGETSKADWDRINAEDQLLLDEIASGLPLGGNANGMIEHDKETWEIPSNERGHNNASAGIVDDLDFSRDSDEEQQALEQLLRLSQHSSQQMDRSQRRNGESSRQAQRSGKANKGPISSQACEMYDIEQVQAPIVDRRSRRPMKSNSSRSSVTPGPVIHREQRSGLSPFHDNDFPFGSSDPSNTQQIRSRSTQPHRHFGPSPHSQSTQFSRPARHSSRAQRPSNQSYQCEFSNRGRANRPRHEARQAEEQIRRLAEKERVRARNRELARKSEEWEALHRRRVDGETGEHEDHDVTEAEREGDTRGVGAASGSTGGNRGPRRRIRRLVGSESHGESESGSRSGEPGVAIKVESGSNSDTDTESESETESESSDEGKDRRRCCISDAKEDSSSDDSSSSSSESEE